MNSIEIQVQKNIVKFCKILPQHMDKWRILLQEAVKPVQAVVNLAQQFRHVEKADIKHQENFKEIQYNLKYEITFCIEEEIVIIKELIEKLNRANQELKNKLLTLENSTLELDWEAKSVLIKGSATQPSLCMLLQDGLEFSTFFAKAFRKINESFKAIDVQNKMSMTNLQDSLSVDLDDKHIMFFIAVTQYVDNAKSIL